MTNTTKHDIYICMVDKKCEVNKVGQRAIRAKIEVAIISTAQESQTVTMVTVHLKSK